MVEMLDYWLRNHPDQPTWKEIADAIEDIHDLIYLLAKSIKAVYDVPSKHNYQTNNNNIIILSLYAS